MDRNIIDRIAGSFLEFDSEDFTLNTIRASDLYLIIKDAIIKQEYPLVKITLCVFFACFIIFFIPDDTNLPNIPEFYFTSTIAISIGIIIAITVQGFNIKMKQFQNNYIIREILLKSGGFCIISGFLVCVLALLFKSLDTKIFLMILLAYLFYTMWKTAIFIFGQYAADDSKLILDNWSVIKKELKKYEKSDYEYHAIYNIRETFDQQILASLIDLNKTKYINNILTLIIDWHICTINNFKEIEGWNPQIGSILSNFIDNLVYNKLLAFLTYLRKTNLNNFFIAHTFSNIFDGCVNEDDSIIFNIRKISLILEERNAVEYNRTFLPNINTIIDHAKKYILTNQCTFIDRSKFLDNTNPFSFYLIFAGIISYIEFNLLCLEELMFLGFCIIGSNNNKYSSFISFLDKNYHDVYPVHKNNRIEYENKKQAIAGAWNKLNDDFLNIYYEDLNVDDFKYWLETEEKGVITHILRNDYSPFSSIAARIRTSNNTSEQIEEIIWNRRRKIFDLIKDIKTVAEIEMIRRTELKKQS